MKKIRLKHILYLLSIQAAVALGYLMWVQLGGSKVYKDVSVYLDAQTLYGDYSLDPDRWSNKYLFNYLEVDGTIEEVTKKKNDQVKLVLKGSDKYRGVECTIVHARKQIRTPLKLGSKITVQGFCCGKKENVMLAGCFIVNQGWDFMLW
jgi:hypothetical protein